MRKKIIIGNWKMYKTMKEAEEFLTEFNEQTTGWSFDCDYGVAASFTNLHVLKAKKASDFIIAAQNCHDQAQGAFTGEVATNMLEELDVSYVIIGHSERREYFNETNESINRKLNWIFSSSKLLPILCCGETLAQYEKQETKKVIEEQIKAALKDLKQEDISKLVIAYEPIWAIGTGKTATDVEAQSVCSEIRNIVANLYSKDIADQVRIQYGGSVKPENIKTFLAQPDIDGALVGSASLKVADFINLLN
ncbi:triose-phosphate isomerase [Spiroplasma platyhelix]|uniref:Triosephosphate isomerase n=1 Tax=Spiroplasma platyhelix PALS-1 TaxID=1276218 RepID=A0A846UE05_9MOLU|nr:triose-phosphate isomerase [Spiroplasma platyhelix]MBE4704346.1 Triosephosphate isomerase [Spiroplasma platyhelix PALS-1]NKE38718.1 triose-phosphate isomerase [Spiroplasma platyhelix PALS-1]UJB28928.1 triosephosphate isomerase [Spiroplasma platyhelix PALS-1]